MRTIASRTAFTLLVSAVVATLVVARAQAQEPDGFWDHYKVYHVNPVFPAPPGMPLVTLRDQFGESTFQVFSFNQFMNPVVKTHGLSFFPIHDPDVHYMWWLLPSQPADFTVSVTNQFGDQPLVLKDAIYLLNPALLNQAGPPPLRNHYKCYTCQGSPVNASIGMTDVYDSWTATVLRPLYFCNPTEKQVGPAGGPTYPIVDPFQHYVCYEFDPVDPNQFQAAVSDQFLQGESVQPYSGYLICVPTLKLGVTATARDTWGRLKLLYR